jgi:hypothetical protein
MFLEKDFEDILSKYPELIEDGLVLKGRQVHVYGRIMDLLFEDRFKRKLIVELKKGPIKDDHIGQVMSYEGILLSADDPTIRIMLIGNRVPPNIQRTLDHHGIAWREISFTRLKEFLAEKNDQVLLGVLDDSDGNLRYKVKETPFLLPKKILTPDEINSGMKEMREYQWENLDQRKYNLNDIFKKRATIPSVQLLMSEFHKSIGSFFAGKSLSWWARTHAYGCSYFCNTIRCFQAINISSSVMIVHYYTGNSQIDGLEKSTWSRKDDRKGSKPFHIKNTEDIGKALIFAEAAYRIAIAELSN